MNRASLDRADNFKANKNLSSVFVSKVTNDCLCCSSVEAPATLVVGNKDPQTTQGESMDLNE